MFRPSKSGVGFGLTSKSTGPDLRDELQQFMRDHLQPALDAMSAEICYQLRTNVPASVIDMPAQPDRLSRSSSHSKKSNQSNSSRDEWKMPRILPISTQRLIDNEAAEEEKYDLVLDDTSTFASHSPPLVIEAEPMLPKKPARADRVLRASASRGTDTREIMLDSEGADLASLSKTTNKKDLSFIQACRSRIKGIVTSDRFDMLFAVLIFFNSILIGLETEFKAQSLHHAELPGATEFYTLFHVTDSLFCIAFTTELVMRVSAFGKKFFYNAWNLFDVILCTTQLLDQVERFSATFRMPLNSSVFRILRMLRMVRISRMVRLLESLRSVMSSLSTSLTSLASTVSLLLLFLYCVSVLFLQLVIDAGDTPNVEEMQYWFGNLGRTFLTMFESIFGGVSWDEPLSVLMSGISPYLAWVYTGFVAFCDLSILNMATGVFVDNALRKAQLDNDTMTSKKITELFFSDTNTRTITYDQFLSKLTLPEMVEYLTDINVDPSAAKFLYQLLDSDGSGSVDADELRSGCMRIRGNAKALELQLLLHETTRMFERTFKFEAWVQDAINKLCSALQV